MTLQQILNWLHKNIIALGVIISTIAGLSGSSIAVYSHFAKEHKVNQSECEIKATVDTLSMELALLRAEIEFSDVSLRLSRLLKIENPIQIIQDEIVKLQTRSSLLSALIIEWRSHLENDKTPEEECEQK